jgi:hypothetical protein
MCNWVTLDGAKRDAQRRATACGWAFSIIGVVNIHTREWEYQVLSFIHEKAVLVVQP